MYIEVVEVYTSLVCVYIDIVEVYTSLVCVYIDVVEVYTSLRPHVRSVQARPSHRQHAVSPQVPDLTTQKQ